MNPALPFRLDDLLHTRTVESNRVEFKATWDKFTEDAVVRTVCAFANDLLNLNGGYVVLGVEEAAGKAVLPPVGLGAMDLDVLQKKIRGACTCIDPDYQPTLFIEYVDGRPLVILWCNGGDNRPYKAPGKDQRQAFYVRQGSQTAEAQDDTLRQLMALTAKIPFDDRRYLPMASVRDISSTLVRRFLREVGSSLDDDNVSDADLYRQLQLVRPINAHEEPRNVALLFFNEHPERFFRCAFIEMAWFRDDAGSDVLDEWKFEGPLPEQIRGCLNLLSGLNGIQIKKRSDQPQSDRVHAFPAEAVREVLVNAVYHRSYDSPPDPVKVYLYPDRLVITSYPGPQPNIRAEHLLGDEPLPSVTARNRRIGDFLKELKLAEARGSGLPQIRRLLKANGSPPPEFAFDLTFLSVTLPSHYRHVMQQAKDLASAGKHEDASELLRRAFNRQPGFLDLTQALVNQEIQTGNFAAVPAVLGRLAEACEAPVRQELAAVYLWAAEKLFDAKQKPLAIEVLNQLPDVPMSVAQRIRQADAMYQCGDLAGAYPLYELALPQHLAPLTGVAKIIDTRLFAYFKGEFAQLFTGEEREQLQCEALELLQGVCAAPRTYYPLEEKDLSDCWRRIAALSEQLGLCADEIEAAFAQAIALEPHQSAHKEERVAWKARYNAAYGLKRASGKRAKVLR